MFGVNWMDGMGLYNQLWLILSTFVALTELFSNFFVGNFVKLISDVNCSMITDQFVRNRRGR